MQEPQTRQGHEYTVEIEGRPVTCDLCGCERGSNEDTRICPKANWIHKSVFDREMRAIVTEFGDIKSGKKLAKKVRQLYGRGLQDAAQQKTDELYKTFEEHIRPKPRWIPTWAWIRMQRIVLVHYV